MDFKKLFEEGISFEIFLEQDQGVNREKTLEIYNQIQLEEDTMHRVEKIDEHINILAFAEIWCPDCMINVPALQKMKEINPNIEIKIVPREGNEEYMETYKVGGKAKIPTFVILNKDFKELGAFIETPKIVKDIVAKGNQVEIIVAKRKYRKGEYLRDTIKEILDIIKVK